MNEFGIYNYSKLRGKIREKGFTQEDVARAASINSSTFSQKICGKASFKQDEISTICTVLDISPCDIGSFFFTS